MNAKITVKKLAPDFQIKNGANVTYWNGTNWGLFQNGELIKSKSGRYEVYNRKFNAVKVAEYLNN